MMNYSCEADSDTLVWPRSMHGILTARVAYAGIQQRFPSVSWGKWIWGPFIPAKRSTTIWRLIHGRLPSWDYLLSRGFSGPSRINATREFLKDHALILLLLLLLTGPLSKNLGKELMLPCTPPAKVIKINVDGGAAGSPGSLTGGGVFRDNFGVFRGCFAVSHGRGFSFEAGLASALFAIELAHDKGWKTIWLESDSTYVVQMLKSNNIDVLWSLVTRWHRVHWLRSDMNMVVSHIFREGNAVADRLMHEVVDKF
ncbi:hypothetical protein ACS0TY_014697 [Phlomoides rotata]